MHSFRVHADRTVTFTRWHESEPAQTKSKGKVDDDKREQREPSKRVIKSRARAAEHEALMSKARAFRAQSLIAWWCRDARPAPPPSATTTTAVSYTHLTLPTILLV